ncbi:MAG: hypothetical protein ACXVXP_00505 [Mycobacteriaceae bacterium]
MELHPDPATFGQVAPEAPVAPAPAPAVDQSTRAEFVAALVAALPLAEVVHSAVEHAKVALEEAIREDLDAAVKATHGLTCSILAEHTELREFVRPGGAKCAEQFINRR